MAYEIPYDSNYGEWYGQPQDVTRLSALLEQSLDEDGYPIGIITASWNMPDNGGTFVAQLSMDGGETYHIAETNIRQNSVVLVVEANTDYYLKIITVLDGQQSSGVVSSLLSSSVTIVPPTPTVVAVQGGMQINVGSIPFGYSVAISINDGTNTTVLYTTNMITIYNCDAGTYTVSTAYSNASNDVGTSSSSVSVTVSELAIADDYVEKTSADYIKSASVNQSGDTLTLTKGDDTTVTFQGGGGGSSYTAGDGIDITNDTISLKTASTTDIGGIIVGENLTIANSVLSADNVYNLKTEAISIYPEDDGQYYCATEDALLLKNEVNIFVTRYQYKYNNIPALVGTAEIRTSNTRIYAILISTSEDGVSTWNNNSGKSNPTSALGSFYDSDRNVTWYYGASTDNAQGYPIDPTYPSISGTYYTSVLAAAQQLLIDANPTVSSGNYEENLFNPTDFTLSSGDTISSVLLQSLITYNRPIVVNGQTFYPLDSSTAGTYIYYSRDYNISVDSSTWEITITPNSGGGYVLPIASSSTLGGIKVGNNLSIDGNGVLSAIGGGGSGGVTIDKLYSGNSTALSVGSELALSHTWKDYDFIEFGVFPNGSYLTSSNPYGVPHIISAKSIQDCYTANNNMRLGISVHSQGSTERYVSLRIFDTKFVVNTTYNNSKVCIEYIHGIKIGDSSLSSQIASLEARIQALESQLS